ncbi:MAG: MFS transporter [Streptococcaceae bacterium]|jgi:DHA2 family metal-tetracycline-proton antiporter-like MFS transporter|nr:MFS transporter [Streptococcaceae bacterium]
MQQVQKPEVQIGKAVPTILFLMVFSLVIDNSFKIISPKLVEYFHVSASTVSWQVTLAGLVIGMGAVVYASLSDSISIKKLLVIGISLISVGSLFGFIFHNNLQLVVLARIIQAAGLGATETLYLIFVSRYVPAEKQKKYYGFSTASFQLATVIGTLTAGFITTYLAWETLFLVPLLSLILIPFLIKFLPKETGESKFVDVIGIILVAAVAVTAMVYLTNFSWLVLGLFIVAVILFLTYISKRKKAFITIDFFKNKLFVFTLLAALLIYSVQASFVLNTFSFLMTEVYKLGLDKVSLMFIPACLAAAAVGSLSGAIAKKLNSVKAVSLSMGVIIASALVASLFMGAPLFLFVGLLILASCAYAMMYAPLMYAGLEKTPEEKRGTAIGFYNLTINIAMSIGFTYSSKFIDSLHLGIFGKTLANHYSEVLFVIAIIAALALLVFLFLVRPNMAKNGRV